MEGTQFHHLCVSGVGLAQAVGVVQSYLQEVHVGFQILIVGLTCEMVILIKMINTTHVLMYSQIAFGLFTSLIASLVLSLIFILTHLSTTLLQYVCHHVSQDVYGK